MSKNLYLTDKQFLELLVRARARLEDVDKVSFYDSTMPGNKYTESNVGLCDDSLTTIDIAMWPEAFPSRNSMKYRMNKHLCPLDTREKHDGNGCFYTCILFKRGMKDLKQIKRAFDKMIKELS